MQEQSAIPSYRKVDRLGQHINTSGMIHTLDERDPLEICRRYSRSRSRSAGDTVDLDRDLLYKPSGLRERETRPNDASTLRLDLSSFENAKLDLVRFGERTAPELALASDEAGRPDAPDSGPTAPKLLGVAGPGQSGQLKRTPDEPWTPDEPLALELASAPPCTPPPDGVKTADCVELRQEAERAVVLLDG